MQEIKYHKWIDISYRYQQWIYDQYKHEHPILYILRTIKRKAHVTLAPYINKIGVMLLQYGYTKTNDKTSLLIFQQKSTIQKLEKELRDVKQELIMRKVLIGYEK